MSFYPIKNYKFTNIYDENELSEMVHNSIKHYRERVDELEERNNELQKNAIKIANKELKDKVESLEKQLSMSYLEFHSEKEKEMYDNFVERHSAERLTMKINGGKVPYLIPYYNGIGRSLTVVCPICGQKEDITDIGVW